MYSTAMRVLLGLGLLGVAGFAGLMGLYFGWKLFALYLPNRASILECLPSGGTCSIDGFANLELSGISTLICGLMGLLSTGTAIWLMKTRA